MADIFDEIAKFDPGITQPDKQPGGDIYDQIAKFDPNVSKAAGEAIVLPGDPREIKEPYSRKGPSASFGTLFKNAFVDDPDTQIKIYAAARFPGLKLDEAVGRYQKRGNKIVYRDIVGNLQTETPDTFWSKIKELAANTGGTSPSIALGIIGTTLGGPVGAGIGAAAGEGVRRLVGHLTLDEPFILLDDAIDVVREGALGVGGEFGSRIFGAAINKTLNIGKASGAKLGKVAMGDMSYMTKAERTAAKARPFQIASPLTDIAEMERLQALGKQFGIDLSVPQIAGNRSLVNRFSLLGDLHQSADLIQEFQKTQNLQIQNAVPNFLDTLSVEKDPFNVGKEIRSAANKAIKGLKGDRAAASRPWYEKAFSNEDTVVDVEPVINYIDTELQTAKGSIRKELLRAKKILEDPDLPRKLVKEDYTYAGVGYNVQKVKNLDDTWKIDIYDDEMSTGLMQKIDDVLRGEPGGRKKIGGYGPDEGEMIGYSSTYPQFMVNKGWSAEEVIKALDKGFSGENLGIRQAEIVEAALSEIEAERIASGMFDPTGGLEAIPETAVRPGAQYTGKYDTSLKGLHGSKMEFDDIIKNARQTGLGNTVKRNYTMIRNMLLDQMDVASSDYTQARLVHALNSPPVEAAEKGLIGSLSKMKDTNLAGAATQMLAARNTSPFQVVRMQKLIKGQNPEAWDSALRDFIRFKFETLKDSQISETSNIGGALRKAVFGNERQRQILKAATTPEQFKNLTDFMDVLQRTGLTFTKESATATRQMELRAMQKETQSEFLTIATSPFRTPERTIADRVNALRFGRGARRLAELILDPKAGEQLKQIKRLTPKSEELMRQLGVFIGIETPQVTEVFRNETEQ